MFIESQTLLHTKDAADSIVNTAHGHLTFLDKLFQQYAGLYAVGLHNHIDAGIDSDAQRLFLVLGYALARVQIINICPVGNQHAVPSCLLLQPDGQQLVVGVYRHAID